MYISRGDNANGEGRNPAMRPSPQRLDTVHGKILRIIPDLKEHVDASKAGENGRYRVPNDNTFVGIAGAMPELWAYGLRNPHRLTWEVDPADSKKNFLFANVIGLNSWETVVIVRKGTNYGYPAREGNQQLATRTASAPCRRTIDSPCASATARPARWSSPCTRFSNTIIRPKAATPSPTGSSTTAK